MSLRMLIIDDEQEILNTLVRFFELEQGFVVKTTTNPFDALEIIQKEKIDIVLSDIKMPEMNGIDLLKEVKKIDGLIQVIMMTAYSTMDVAIRCMENGANDLVLKPFDSLDDLNETINLAKEKIARWKKIIKKSYKVKS